MFHHPHRIIVLVFIVAVITLSANAQTKGKRDKRVEERNAKALPSVTSAEPPAADYLRRGERRGTGQPESGHTPGTLAERRDDHRVPVATASSPFTQQQRPSDD